MKTLYNILYFILIIPAFSSFELFSQSRADSLEIAKVLRNKNELEDALEVLKAYHSSYPDDLNGAWLYAQTACWMKKYKLAENVYETAVIYHPENYSLKLDYALALSETGEMNKSLSLLKQCYAVDPYNTTTLFALARIYFWRLEFDKSKEILNHINAITPGDKNALALSEEISRAEAFILHAHSEFCSDNQPLATLSFIAEGGQYFNELSSLYYNVKTTGIFVKQDNSASLWFRLGNSSLINNAGLKLEYDAGLLKLPYSAGNKITWNVKAEKKIFNSFALSAQVEQKPYFNTLSSLDNGILYKNIDLSLMWNKPSKWNGNVTYNIAAFKGGNVIKTLAAWVMSKPYNISCFGFNAGFGFNYSSAKENMFVPEKTVSQLINQYSGEAISGVYNPYFTPYRQNIHSVIVAVSCKPSKKITLNARLSAGVFAKTKNPYLYLDTKSNSFVIVKDYYDKKYFPFDIGLSSNINVGKNTMLKFSYLYSNTNFYSRNLVDIGVLFFFTYEKK